MMRVIASEDDMRAALRERRLGLRLSQEQAEHDVGLTRGHIGKIENWHQPWGKRVFRMTPTLEWLFERYGVTLIMVDAPGAMIHGPRRSAPAKRCPETLDLFADRGRAA